jgi:membrane protein
MRLSEARARPDGRTLWAIWAAIAALVIVITGKSDARSSRSHVGDHDESDERRRARSSGGRKSISSKAGDKPAGRTPGRGEPPQAREQQEGKEHASKSAARERGRGRQAESPEEIPVKGWKDIAKRVFKEVSDDRVLTEAGGVAYFVLLAVFPGIAAFVSVYGLFADRATIAEHLSILTGLLPGGAITVITDELKRLTAQDEATLGLTMVFGIAVSLWSANAGMKALFDTMNIAYDETEKRGFIRLNIISLTFTLCAIAFMLAALALVVVLPASDLFGWAVEVVRWPVMFVVVAAALGLIYRYGPSRDKARWRWITWGSGIAAALWIGASMLFSWYAENFGSYDETYGSLGAVVGFMTWIWISAIVILLGAEINAEMEHQTARDTTEGTPKPLGQRGAVMADSIGAAQD